MITLAAMANMANVRTMKIASGQLKDRRSRRSASFRAQVDRGVRCAAARSMPGLSLIDRVDPDKRSLVRRQGEEQ